MASQRVVLTDNDIPRLREEWMGKIDDLVSGIPLELPPLHEVNHEINLVDPAKRISYRLPKCPEHFGEDLSTKIEIHHHRVVGTSSSAPSGAYAVRTKKERYTLYRLRSA
jgi:hypothetical protein